MRNEVWLCTGQSLLKLSQRPNQSTLMANTIQPTCNTSTRNSCCSAHYTSAHISSNQYSVVQALSQFCIEPHHLVYIYSTAPIYSQATYIESLLKQCTCKLAQPEVVVICVLKLQSWINNSLEKLFMQLWPIHLILLWNSDHLKKSRL